MKVTFLFLFLLIFMRSARADHPPFHSPIDIPMQITGSFGELRSNHFHAGIDIRTNGQIGLPIYSGEKGSVSRISVSPSGYGLALYIEHPNGYTTVYGHLDRFAPKIATWVREKQYERKKFALNLEPEKGAIAVERGELIGWSGNSGSSGGPHLHYEIRNSKSERPINPFLLGFKVPDTKSPVINSLHFFPLSNNSHVSGLIRKTRYNTVLYNGIYHPEKTTVFNAYGEIGLGVEVIDYIDGTWSKCGIYHFEMKVDSKTVFSFSLDSLNYNLSSHFLSHIDYAHKTKGGATIHRAFKQPGNRLEIYGLNLNHGIITIETGKTYPVEIKISDFAGNASVLKFSIKGVNPTPHPPKNALRNFRFNSSNSYRDEQLALTLPEGALFDDLDFHYQNTDSVPSWAFSPIHQVHTDDVPLGKPVNLAIKTMNLPDSLETKALIVKIDPSGRKNNMGGNFKNGWVETTVRSFGNYCITIDRTPPVITPLSIKGKNTLTEPNRIRFRITDNLSGIDTYTGTIDDEWVLFEYDQKSNTLTYNFDDKLIKGKRHDLKLLLVDSKNNASEYKATFWK